MGYFDFQSGVYGTKFKKLCFTDTASCNKIHLKFPINVFKKHSDRMIRARNKWSIVSVNLHQWGMDIAFKTVISQSPCCDGSFEQMYSVPRPAFVSPHTIHRLTDN